MKSEMDRRIHDYLDGRLAEGEEAEFEKRIAHDAALSERVEEYHRIRSALREEADDLSPGFYTRARAEFESRETGGARRGFRIISWETAGLAVATGLAIAVFVPGLLQDGSVLPPAEIETDATAPASSFDDAPTEPSEQKLQKQELAEPPVDRLKQKSDPDESTTTFGRAAGPTTPAPSAPPTNDEGDQSGKKRAEKEELQFAPLPEPPATTMRNEKRAAGERARSQSLADLSEEESIEESHLDGWPLPGGAVAPGEIRVATGDKIAMGAEDAKDAESFRQDKGSSQRTGSLRTYAAAPEPGKRHVLIGPRERAFSCVGIVVRKSGDIWVIVLSEPAAARPVSESGCGVALPDDGVAFRVEGPGR